MDMHMNYPRMLLCPSLIRQRHRALANRLCFHSIGVPGRRSRLEIPESARGPHYERLDKQRHHVMVVRMIVIDPAHLGGIVIVPAIKLLQRNKMWFLKSPGEGLDQLALNVGCLF